MGLLAKPEFHVHIISGHPKVVAPDINVQLDILGPIWTGTPVRCNYSSATTNLVLEMPQNVQLANFAGYATTEILQQLGLTVITIDGTNKSGRSTLAQLLTKHIGGMTLSADLYYRWVVKHLPAANDDVSRVPPPPEYYIELVQDTSLYSPSVNTAMARYATHLEARQLADTLVLRACVQAYINGCDLLIIEGEYVGSVLMPNADVGFYLDGPLELRATRSLTALGYTVDLLPEEVYQAEIQSLKDLDALALSRNIYSPVATSYLRLIENTGTPQETLEKMLNLLPAAILPTEKPAE